MDRLSPPMGSSFTTTRAGQTLMASGEFQPAGARKVQSSISIHPTGGWVVVADGNLFHLETRRKVFLRSIHRFRPCSIRDIAPDQSQLSWGLTVSPDRRSFLYAQSDESGSDLMLVENFR